ncbi:hypothetical protein J2744_000061 [Halorubrum trapanicum]|uniref:Apea-like HEPN domain-containing protein n=1 Tax=Halorubrum trapanicum TaxID=29284 RepID=A0A8J7UKV0_9EURY|nr:HEPN domain-containing protein [Halorubrum trapanicum]MBP1900409.1 hypothetical protein [Halorubrum trapanicum]
MSQTREDLHSLLYDLAEEAIEIAQSNSDGDIIETTEVPYLERRYQTIDDSIDGSRIIRTTEEESNKNEISTDVLRDTSQQLQETEIYDRVISEVESREFESLIVPSPESSVTAYIQSILNGAKNGVSDRDIARHISIFTSEIDSAPISWNPKIWILGLDIEDDSVQLEENITIRKPDEDDLVEEIRIEDDAGFNRRATGMPERAPTAIIEFSKRAPDRRDIYDTIQVMISVLQLYDVGSVSSMKVDLHTESIIKPFPLPGRYNSPDTPFSYTISESEISDLSLFYTHMYEVVEERLYSTDEQDYLTISFDRYENAIEENDSPESQLTSAIMSLEAMLLKDEEKGELSERLSRRADILLGLFGHQPIEISRKIKTAYSIRSRYVHGSETDQDYGEDLVSDIVDYTRNCIVIYLLLSEDFPKEKLLSKLDNASVQAESREALSEKIQEVVPEWAI